MNLQEEFGVFHDFRDMALPTAGSPEDFNTMTIGWGALGTIWGKPACTVYVRPSRYTLEFMDRNELFTVSFFDGHKSDLSYLGRVSGRDEDKVAKTELPLLYDGVHLSEEGHRAFAELMAEAAKNSERTAFGMG